MDVSSHTVLLPAGSDAPEWVHLMPAGSFSGVDRRGPYHLKDPAGVIAASMAAGKIALDENHATELAHASGSPGPARGWIVDMQPRDDGIWAKMDWNGSGKALMADRAYRGISPVFEFTPNGKDVTRIISAALTNKPNLTLTALHTQGDMMDKKAICTALGIAETTGEAEVLTALQGAQTALQTAQKEVIRLSAEVTTLKTTRPEAETVVALQTQLDVMKQDRALEKATAFVDAAIKQGKPVMPARAQYIAMHVSDPAGIETMINALPSINAASGAMRMPPGGNADPAAMMTQDEAKLCAAMGIKPEDFMKTRAKTAATTEGSAA